jgi:hypothetical protein
MAKIRVCPNEDDSVSAVGNIHMKTADSTRLLLVDEALTFSVALAYDERRIATTFEQIGGRQPDRYNEQVGGKLETALFARQAFQNVERSYRVGHSLAFCSQLNSHRWTTLVYRGMTT